MDDAESVSDSENPEEEDEPTNESEVYENLNLKVYAWQFELFQNDYQATNAMIKLFSDDTNTVKTDQKQYGHSIAEQVETVDDWWN